LHRGNFFSKIGATVDTDGQKKHPGAFYCGQRGAVLPALEINSEAPEHGGPVRILLGSIENGCVSLRSGPSIFLRTDATSAVLVEEMMMEDNRYNGHPRPEPRSSALARVARQTLGIPLVVPAAALKKNWSTISNFESGMYRLSAEIEQELLAFYISEFGRRGIDVDSLPDHADLPELRIALAKAVISAQATEVSRRTQDLEGAMSGVDLGSSDFLERAIEAALRMPALPVVTRRLLKLIADHDEASAQVAPAGE
jgi:hypothetical protein